MLFLTGGPAAVHAQEACGFVGGFAELRALVGEQKIGACLENEHFNIENGNSEQRTTGGLLVWRKGDNFTAFTDGGTTWVNGPNGLQSRPNNERLAWELDPVVPVSAPASPTPRPLPTLPVTVPLASEPVTAPRVQSDGATIGAPNVGVQARTGSAPAAPAANTLPPPPAASNAPSAASATPVPGGTPTTITAAAGSTGVSTAASTVPPPPPPAANTVASAAAAPTATPTKTATPKLGVTAKFSERPEDVETGNDAQIEVETNAKGGTCFLVVTYRNTPDASMGAKEIDDGKCEWKFTLAANTKTGKAKAVVTVVAADGQKATAEETFSVKKGDSVYSGSIDVEVDPIDMPDDDVAIGEELKIGVDTNLKRKGSCALTMTWPKVGPANAGSQMPDASGKCTWKVKVPADVPTKSTASLTITVYKDSGSYRTLTREFKVK